MPQSEELQSSYRELMKSLVTVSSHQRKLMTKKWSNLWNVSEMFQWKDDDHQDLKWYSPSQSEVFNGFQAKHPCADQNHQTIIWQPLCSNFEDPGSGLTISTNYSEERQDDLRTLQMNPAAVRTLSSPRLGRILYHVTKTREMVFAVAIKGGFSCELSGRSILFAFFRKTSLRQKTLKI